MPSLTPAIRIATGADSEAAAAVARAVYEEYSFLWDLDDLLDLETNHLDRGCFWVAEDAGQIIGIAGLARRNADMSDVICDGELRRVYVHPGARRRGVASALMRAALACATEWGCWNIAVWTDKRFEGAHRMYERLGACRVLERELGDINDSAEWGYVLPVRGA